MLQPRPERLFDESDPWRMRFALPGRRHKLALVYDESEDRWAWPRPGLPSTHIVKPEPPERPGIAANEHACSLAYRDLGFPVVHTAVETIAGQTCLVSKRFDRWGEARARSACTRRASRRRSASPPTAPRGGSAPATPSLREASGLLRAIGEADAVETLMRVTICDLLIGCTELRGGNAGLLLGAQGSLLAPFHGIVSTEVYGEVRPRPVVVGAPPAPLLVDLRYTIEFCGLELQPALIDAVKLMGLICGALNTAAELAQEEGWHREAIEDALQLAMGRIESFRHESLYLRPRG